MLKSYFTIAIRQFWKNKSFSFINIAGLALSMAICLLVILLIKDANSYDTFHPQGDRVYRINTEALRKGGGTEGYATSPYILGQTLVKDYEGTEAWVQLNSRLSTDIIFEDRKFNFNLVFTGKEFFNVFGFTLKNGDKSRVLNDPYTIVLTQPLADKLFPSGNAVGQSVEVQGQGLFKITGILNAFPGKTHMDFEALASVSTIPSLEKNNTISNTTTDWRNYYTNYSFIRLKPGVSPQKIEAALASITKKQYTKLPLESRDAGYRFYLQPLNKITPSPMLSNTMGNSIPSVVLWFMAALAFIIMMSAIFNYTNLTIAKAMGRMKEIALRKVVGSSRRHIFLQVVTESVVTSLFALLIACIFLMWLIPNFNSLSIISLANIRFHIDATVAILFFVFALVVGMVAGIFPAVVLSRVKPLVLMQKLQNLRLFRHLGLRKGLLVIQFMISLVFINMVNITYRQTQHGVNVNFGTQQTHIFNIHLQGQTYSKAVAEFIKVPGVEKISAISQLMGTYHDGKEDVRTSNDNDPIGVREYFVDENYISNLHIKLIAGQDFPANPQQRNEQFAIVNEKFLEYFKLGKAGESIGKTIIVGDSLTLTIHGVVKNFLFKPADYALEPLLMRYTPDNWNVLNLQIASGDMMQTTAELEAVWKKLDPYHTFQGKFYVDEIQTIFSEQKEIIWMVAFIGMLGVVIACLGLLGITIFTVQSKIREISIRKVIGASPASIIRLLTKSYVQVMLIAIALAVPIAMFLGNMMLQEMGQRISLTVWIFIPGVLLIVLISLITVGSQTVKAVLTNPIKSLRTE